MNFAGQTVPRLRASLGHNRPDRLGTALYPLGASAWAMRTAAFLRRCRPIVDSQWTECLRGWVVG